MKAIKVLANPALVIMSFFIILINGEGWGGFFLLYLLFGLPYRAIHSIIAMVGIALLIFGNNKKKRTKRNETVIGCLIEIGGILFLLLSLFLFFYNDKEQYNFGTFYQLVPLLTLALFVIIAFIVIVSNITCAYKIYNKSLKDFRV